MKPTFPERLGLQAVNRGCSLAKSLPLGDVDEVGSGDTLPVSGLAAARTRVVVEDAERRGPAFRFGG
jgi:hypothetical protein